MTYANSTVDTAIQTQQGGKVLAIGSGGTLALMPAPRSIFLLRRRCWVAPS